MTEEFNVDLVGDLLDGRWAPWRRTVREMMTSDEFRKRDELTYHEHRERVLEQLQTLTDEGVVTRAFPERLGGMDDHGGNIAGFEELVLGDPSMQIKGGVQWGLFGAAVLHLGTKEHHDRFLPGVMDLTVPGVFALTEIRHGSD